MADDLLDMRVLVRVAEAGSLSAAARELGLSLAVVSRKLARLEDRLGVRLVNRTTRTLTLTDEGALFEMRCARILGEIEDAEREAARGQQDATGLPRVTATAALGRRHIAPLLRSFQARHPGLRIHLDTTDAVVDIVGSGYDLAIRVGALPDSSLIARQLASNRRVVCGSPAYLDARGRPTEIDALAAHDCITYGNPPPARWTFLGGSVPIRGRFSTNDGELAHSWALDGAGLILKSIWDVGPDIAAGRLEIVLPDHQIPAAPIQAVYPHHRHAAAKVRLCVAFLADRLHRGGALHGTSA